MLRGPLGGKYILIFSPEHPTIAIWNVHAWPCYAGDPLPKLEGPVRTENGALNWKNSESEAIRAALSGSLFAGYTLCAQGNATVGSLINPHRKTYLIIFINLQLCSIPKYFIKGSWWLPAINHAVEKKDCSFNAAYSMWNVSKEVPLYVGIVKIETTTRYTFFNQVSIHFQWG